MLCMKSASVDTFTASSNVRLKVRVGSSRFPRTRWWKLEAMWG
jgi:hypothetical protein